MAYGTELVGRVLGDRYRLVAPVGVGASATVFQADDVQLRRRVAVKVLHPTLADDPSFLKRFRAEAQAAAALAHPNIVSVFDWGEDHGQPYLVTEYLAMGSLRSMLDVGRRLTPSQALVVGLEAARGLDYAHKRGLVHRDVKPANLLFGDDGRLRIADFGLARAVAEAAWTEPAGVVLGTARYASPEQARGLAVDGKTDVYSLALVLVEAITGQVPFAADTTVATLMARLDRLMPVSADLGPLASVIERAGRPDPEERFDAAELGRALVLTAERLPRPQPLPLVPNEPDAGTDATALGVRAFDPGPVPPAAAPGPANPLPDVVNGVDDITTLGAPPGSVIARPSAAVAPTPPGQPPAADAGDLVPFDGEPPRRRRRWRGVLLGVLILALLGAGGAAAWIAVQNRTPTYPVPPVVNLSEAAARNVLLPFEFEVTTETTRLDGTVAGQVVAQRPEANVVIDKGAPVVLVVSQGPPLRAVPDLAGQTVEQASTTLTGAGFAVGTRTDVNDEVAPAGTVLSWTLAGQTVPAGTPVDLTVSAGPAPRTVPKVAGEAYDAAVAALAGVQLGASRTDAFSDTVPAGAVVSSDPAAGAQAPRDAVVALVVSKGPDLVTVPDVAGLSLDAAIAQLRAAGLVEGSVSGKAGRKVLNTDPRIGVQTKRGSRVDLILG